MNKGVIELHYFRFSMHLTIKKTVCYGIKK